MKIENMAEMEEQAAAYYRAMMSVKALIDGWAYDSEERVFFQSSTDEWTDDNVYHRECKDGFAALTGHTLMYDDRDPVYMVASYEGAVPALAFLLIRSATGPHHIIAEMATV